MPAARMAVLVFLRSEDLDEAEDCTCGGDYDHTKSYMNALRRSFNSEQLSDDRTGRPGNLAIFFLVSMLPAWMPGYRSPPAQIRWLKQAAGCARTQHWWGVKAHVRIATMNRDDDRLVTVLGLVIFNARLMALLNINIYVVMV
jgi:hypothetical protein